MEKEIRELADYMLLLPEFIVLSRADLTQWTGNDDREEQILWQFDNGYGASLACNRMTHFKPELAHVQFSGHGHENFDISGIVSNITVSGLALELAKLRGCKESNL
jgi:hypothetical protein